MKAILETTSGWKVHGTVALFLLCIAVEIGLGWDIAGFEAPDDWLNQVLVALGISAGRSTVGNIISTLAAGRK